MTRAGGGDGSLAVWRGRPPPPPPLPLFSSLPRLQRERGSGGGCSGSEAAAAGAWRWRRLQVNTVIRSFCNWVDIVGDPVDQAMLPSFGLIIFVAHSNYPHTVHVHGRCSFNSNNENRRQQQERIPNIYLPSVEGAQAADGSQSEIR